MHPHVPTQDELAEDGPMLLFLTSEPMPSIETIQRYQPRTWTREELEMYLLRRKQLHNSEINTLYDQQAKALDDLEKDFWISEDPTPTDPNYSQDMKDKKTTEILTLKTRFARIAETINLAYLHDIVPKTRQLEEIRRPAVVKSSYHIVPPIQYIPRTMPEFQRLKAEYMREELAKLLFKHVNAGLSQNELDKARWWRGHALTDLNALRTDYIGHAQFREWLQKHYGHLRNRASAV